MTVAWTEWWQGVRAALLRFPGPTPGTSGAGGTSGAPEGEGDPDEPGPAAGVPGPSYNQLVRDAIADAARTDRMNSLDENRTADRIKVLRARSEEQRLSLRTTVVYCTGGVVVVLFALAGLMTVAGVFHLTSAWVLAPMIATAMSLVTGFGVRLGQIMARHTAADHDAGAGSLSEDRRAVTPDETSPSGRA
ncbi:hypothetical protein ACLVWQ_38520 [Streptomyces sp. CWNU-52B]|uniref:hypothetical protein n=1 Tax=unclassified Streptomyces TaxID=2593676 RepID=UPI0039BF24F4